MSEPFGRRENEQLLNQPTQFVVAPSSLGAAKKRMAWQEEAEEAKRVEEEEALEVRLKEEAKEVSERSELALWKTSILAMNQHPRNGYRHYITATSTTKLTLFHSIFLARFTRFALASLKCAQSRFARNAG